MTIYKNERNGKQYGIYTQGMPSFCNGIEFTFVDTETLKEGKTNYLTSSIKSSSARYGTTSRKFENIQTLRKRVVEDLSTYGFKISTPEAMKQLDLITGELSADHDIFYLQEEGVPVLGVAVNRCKILTKTPEQFISLVKPPVYPLAKKTVARSRAKFKVCGDGVIYPASLWASNHNNGYIVRNKVVVDPKDYTPRQAHLVSLLEDLTNDILKYRWKTGSTHPLNDSKYDELFTIKKRQIDFINSSVHAHFADTNVRAMTGWGYSNNVYNMLILNINGIRYDMDSPIMSGLAGISCASAYEQMIVDSLYRTCKDDILCINDNTNWGPQASNRTGVKLYYLFTRYFKGDRELKTSDGSSVYIECIPYYVGNPNHSNHPTLMLFASRKPLTFREATKQRRKK